MWVGAQSAGFCTNAKEKDKSAQKNLSRGVEMPEYEHEVKHAKQLTGGKPMTGSDQVSCI